MKSLTNLPDQELIHLYMNGNTEAFASLVNRYKDKIYTSIHLLVKDKYLAEDIFQDSFERVITTLKSGRYTDEDKFLPWVIRIAHNLCIDHFRKIKSKPIIKTIGDKDIFNVLNFSGPGADQRMMQRQSHEKIREMIDMLPESQREVVILKHYAGLTFGEIAILTKCGVNTALGRMHYAINNLRKIIEDKHMVL
jgi:RNA polymerase sigma factor (sigma-70 family)